MTNPTPASIADLRNQMKQLGESGDAKDLVLTPAAQNNYLQLIQQFCDDLQEQLHHVQQIPDFGNVGNLWSAVGTKDDFEDDRRVLVTSLRQCIAYLADHRDGVTAFFNRMQAADHA